VDVYNKLTVRYISGHNPDLFILDTNGDAIEQIDLIQYKTLDELHALMKSKGFTTTTSLRNSHEDCYSWAERGECEINPAFMQQTCAKACDRELVDTDAGCRAWAAQGDCNTNPKFMRMQCAKTCKDLDKLEL